MTFLDPDNFRLVRDVDAPAYVRHPAHAGRVVRLVAIGHDGATIDRYPATAPGHIKGAS